MLSKSLKTEIQEAYSRLLANKGFKARYCQKVMTGKIARTLAGTTEMPVEDKSTVTDDAPSDALQKAEPAPADGGNICVIEAGTGTGKTIAYALAAIPLANALDKKVVISTATIALQEQIVYQDLPDIRKHSGLDFSFTLAKGRRRYLCLSRLELALQDNAQARNHTLAFYEAQALSEDSRSENTQSENTHNEKNTNHQTHTANPLTPDQPDLLLYKTMLAELDKNNWDGDRDNWPTELAPGTWQRVSTDNVQCTGKQCTHYENC